MQNLPTRPHEWVKGLKWYFGKIIIFMQFKSQWIYFTSNISEFITCSKNSLGTTKVLKAFLSHVDYHNRPMTHEWCLGPSAFLSLSTWLQLYTLLLIMALLSLLTICLSLCRVSLRLFQVWYLSPGMTALKLLGKWVTLNKTVLI